MPAPPKIRLSVSDTPTLVDRLNMAFGKLYDYLNVTQAQLIAAASAPAAPAPAAAPAAPAGTTVEQVTVTGSGPGGAPGNTTASYITAVGEPALAHSRRLAAGANITLADGGSGGTLSVAATVPNLKSQRVTTGSVPAGGAIAVVLTWTTAFADANYTVVAEVEDPTNNLSVFNIVAHDAATVTVQVTNTQGGGGAAHIGTLHVIAVHD